MRRFAGNWVRSQALSRLHLIIAASAGMAGFGLHSVFAYAIEVSLGPAWIGRASIAAMALAVLPLLLAWRSMERGSIARWLKGADSEQNIGQAIEYAITAPHCAVAHSVTALTDADDIDHLVATPGGLWVVETKHRRVPRKTFPRTLSAIARKVKETRAWAPPGTPVRGCLVLDNPEGAMQRRRQASGETIFVYTAGSLAKALAEEAGAYPSVSPELANAVWELGKAEA